MYILYSVLCLNYRFNSLCIYQLRHSLAICTARHRAVARLHKGCSGITIAQQNKGGGLLALGTGVTAGTSRTSDSCFLFCTLQAVLWETESRRIHSTREQERGGRAGRHTGGGVEEYPPSACHWLRHRPYHKPRGENPRPIRDGDSYDVIRRGSRMFRVVWR